jgi:predicted GIY-YIG superfamily endonuclease
MDSNKKPRGYWTKEKCIEAAKECETKSEFAVKFNGAYKISRKYGWINELQINFKQVGSKYKRCIYACEFENNYVYVGLTYNFDKRCKQHLQNNDSAIFKFIEKYKLKPNFKIIIDYIPYNEASIKEGIVLNEYKNKGWNILNRTKTGGLGSKDSDIVRKWTYEKCWDAVKECNSYKDFDEKYGGAKSYAERHGFINEIKKYFNVDDSRGYKKWTYEKCIDKINECNSITEYQEKYPGAYGYLRKRNELNILRENYKLLQRDKWTFDEALNEALKYKTKKEFDENASGCYQVCYKNGWLNDVCKHMVDLKKERIIYTDAIVIEHLKHFSKMEHLKKSDNKFDRGCYWWLKKHKLIIEYKKYLKHE